MPEHTMGVQVNQAAFDNWLNTPGNTAQTSDGRTSVGVFGVWVP